MSEERSKCCGAELYEPFCNKWVREEFKQPMRCSKCHKSWGETPHPKEHDKMRKRGLTMLKIIRKYPLQALKGLLRYLFKKNID